ncbi:hypothetical protein ACVGXN_00240, partial [Enterobacter hormaechei]
LAFGGRDHHSQISAETISEVTDFVVIDKQNAMAVFTTTEHLDPIIDEIEKQALNYTHLTLPTNSKMCRSRWSAYE